MVYYGKNWVADCLFIMYLLCDTYFHQNANIKGLLWLEAGVN